MSQFTVFPSYGETRRGSKYDIHWVVDHIKKGGSKKLVEAIRKEADDDARTALKLKLTCILFSGVFRRRRADAIVSHSGYICVDFDGVKDMDALRETLIADPFTHVLFKSPSGNGFKVVVKVPAVIKEHRGRFEALMAHYNRDDFDKKVSDVCRICFASYDPDIYYDPNSEVFTDQIEHLEYDLTKEPPLVRLHSDDTTISYLSKWSERKYPIAKGQRNTNSHILAAAFNRCGVSKVAAGDFLRGYATEGFSEKEIQGTIDSAYKNTKEHGTGGFNDDKTEAYIRRRGFEGITFDDISKEIQNDIPEEKERNDTIERVLNSKDGTKFWVQSPKGGITIHDARYKNFLQENGFQKLRPTKGESFIFVMVEDNLVANTGESLIKDYVIDYVEREGGDLVYNHVAKRAMYFTDKYLNTLGSAEIEFAKDTQSYGNLFFRNCVVRVHRGGKVELIDYVKLDGYVWAEHIIDRDFIKDNTDKGDFCRFMELISSENLERINAMRTTIGYLLHGYKDMSNNRAVIYNDGVINDSPNGGSGKGIICQAIGKIKRTSTLDGKSFSFEKGFPYQTVSADTQVLVFDDVPDRFPFERLFSVITEGIVLEKKNKDAVKIPVEDSPKIVITTNYTIQGKGGSHDRRRHEVEMSGHFNANYTPIDEFGHQLFDGWPKDGIEWSRFDNYMVNCLAMYLDQGLVNAEWDNLPERKLRNNTSSEFVEWLVLDDGTDRFKLNERIYRATELETFQKDYPDYASGKYRLSGKKFVHWLDAYALHKGWNATTGRDAHVGRYTIFHLPDEAPIKSEAKAESEIIF